MTVCDVFYYKKRSRQPLLLQLLTVCGGQQRFRDGKAERLRGLEVDDKFEFRRLLNRQVGRFLAF